MTGADTVDEATELGPLALGSSEGFGRTARSCKSCRFLGVHHDAKGRIVVRANNAYECLVVVPQPALPESMTRAYGYRWPPAKSYMTGDSGRECPTWEQRE